MFIASQKESKQVRQVRNRVSQELCSDEKILIKLRGQLYWAVVQPKILPANMNSGRLAGTKTTATSLQPNAKGKKGQKLWNAADSYSIGEDDRANYDGLHFVS